MIQMVKRSRDEVMCGGARILKTLVTPIVDINTKTTYQGDEGLWRDNRTNATRYFSMDGFFSRFATLGHESIRVVGRQCKLTRDITVSSGGSRDFLNEAFTISTNKSFTLTETCRDGESSIIETCAMNGTIHLTLPVTCTLERAQKVIILKIISFQVNSFV